MRNVSVIVCTRNRSSIKDCLRSLSNLSYPSLEIMIVDGSNQNFAARNQKITESLGMRYIYEKKLGLSIARNKGIKFSSGEIVAFTDDDCIVDRFWIRNLVKNYVDKSVACVTGRVLPFENQLNKDCYTLAERFMFGDKGKNKRIFSKFMKSQKFLDMAFSSISRLVSSPSYLSLNDTAPIPFCCGGGANMSFSKEMFNHIGYFDEKLGAGSPGKSADDLDMILRVYENAFKIIYEPCALVYHAHRITIEQNEKLAHDYGFGMTRFFMKHSYKPKIGILLPGRFLQLLLFELFTLLRKNIIDSRVTYMSLRGMLRALFL